MKEDTAKTLTEADDDKAQSLAIDWLRFPMALAVVFMHNFGSKPVNLDQLHAHPLSIESLCDFVRITLSHVATNIAVPCFFMISGYLFFCKTKEWNKTVYLQKLRKRFCSLFVPYLLWILIFIVYTICQEGYLEEADWGTRLWRYFRDEGGLHLFWDSHRWALNYTNWLGQAVPMTGPALIPLWFLRDLWVMVLASPLVYVAVVRLREKALLLLGLCFVSDIWIPLPGFSITAAFWFTAGAYFGINKLNMAVELYRWRIPAAIIALATLLPLIWLNGRRGDDVTTNTVAQWLQPLYVLAGVLTAMSVAFWLVKQQKVTVHRKLAKATFFIFLTHPFALRRVNFWIRDINRALATHTHVSTDYPLLLAEYLLTPVVSVALCLGAYWLFCKFCPTLLSLLTGSRK